MKATQLLKQQHREVEAIFQAIKSGKGDTMVLVEKLADALVAHMAIEQKLFYPAVKKVDEDLIYESFEEHASAEVALRRLLSADPLDPTFKAKVTVLEELIKHHVEEEEQELFPKVDDALGERLETLGEELETMFTEAMEEGHEATLRKAPKSSVDEDEVNMLSPNFSGRPSAPSFA
jgi:hemerythrin-like domain-containing protein